MLWSMLQRFTHFKKENYKYTLAETNTHTFTKFTKFTKFTQWFHTANHIAQGIHHHARLGHAEGGHGGQPFVCAHGARLGRPAPQPPPRLSLGFKHAIPLIMIMIIIRTRDREQSMQLSVPMQEPIFYHIAAGCSEHQTLLRLLLNASPQINPCILPITYKINWIYDHSPRIPSLSPGGVKSQKLVECKNQHLSWLQCMRARQSTFPHRLLIDYPICGQGY